MNKGENEQSIKLIALDLDGTTLDDQGKVTADNKRTIEEAIREKIHVVVSTGRAFSAIPEDVWSIDGLRYAITSNGAHITDLISNETIYNSYITDHAIEMVLKYTKEYDLMLEAFYLDQAYIDAELYNKIEREGSPYRNKDYVLATRRPLEDVFNFIKKHSDKIENINIFFDDLKKREEMLPIIHGIAKATITSSFPNNIEVGGVNTSKYSALCFLGKTLGIREDEMMGCGDAPNDIAMIKGVGLGVAMGNAWEETKDAADYVTLSNNESGVAKAIKKFVLK